jgi:hypothetical protein
MVDAGAFITVARMPIHAQVRAQPPSAIFILGIIAWDNIHTSATREPAIRLAGVTGGIGKITFVTCVNTLTPCASRTT